MKFRTTWLPLLAALALPGALRAQEEEECPCRRPGMIGVVFGTEGDRSEGVAVMEVRAGSPAARAGVRQGDVVVRVNGGAAAAELDALPGHLQAGDSVRIRVQRADGEHDIVVVAAPRPASQSFSFMQSDGDHPIVFLQGLDSLNIPLQALTLRIDSLQTQLADLHGQHFQVELDSLVRVFTDSSVAWAQRMPMQFQFRREMPEDVMVEGLAFAEERPFFMELGRRAVAGADLAEMNEGLSAYFGGQREGALVIEVSEETPAARAGLRPGDVIVRAGGEAVLDPEDVRHALTRAEAGRVSLEVVRRGQRQELSLEWAGPSVRTFRRESRERTERP
jgi:predicted metalloprotease with PDZ domain